MDKFVLIDKCNFVSEFEVAVLSFRMDIQDAFSTVHLTILTFKHYFDPGDPAFANFSCRNSHSQHCQCWDALAGMAHRFNIKAGDSDRSFLRIPNLWMERGQAWVNSVWTLH